MVFVPYITGISLVSRVHPPGIPDALLGATWLLGYFAFNAASLVLKSRPERRRKHFPALATYCALTATAGLGTLIGTGPGLLWWVPIYAVLLPAALWLVAHKRERSALSGTLTVLASCMLMVILRFGTPASLVRDASSATYDLWVILAVTGYFIGTIWHVKALIRDRRKPMALWRSVAYHLLLAVALIVLAPAGQLTWPWVIFAVVLPLRAALIPAIAAGRQLRPSQIGIIEITLSVALTLLVICSG